MASIVIKCQNCRRQFVGQSGRQGKLGLMQIANMAIKYGWIQAGDGFICSESCAADHAVDVTPKDPRQIEHLS